MAPSAIAALIRLRPLSSCSLRRAESPPTPQIRAESPVDPLLAVPVRCVRALFFIQRCRVTLQSPGQAAIE